MNKLTDAEKQRIQKQLKRLIPSVVAFTLATVLIKYYG